MAYGDFKDLSRRTASDKILRDKHLILLKIQNRIDIKRFMLHFSIDFWIKNSIGLHNWSL